MATINLLLFFVLSLETLVGAYYAGGYYTNDQDSPQDTNNVAYAVTTTLISKSTEVVSTTTLSNGRDTSTQPPTVASTSEPKTPTATINVASTTTTASSSSSTTGTPNVGTVTTTKYKTTTLLPNDVDSKKIDFTEIEKIENEILNLAQQCSTFNSTITVTTSNMELYLTNSHVTNKIQSLTENKTVIAPAGLTDVNETYFITVGFLNLSSDIIRVVKNEIIGSSNIARQEEIRISSHLSVNFFLNKTGLKVSAPIAFSVENNVMDTLQKEIVPTLSKMLMVDVKVRCAFINLAKKTYSSFGCKETVDENFVSCYCNHTTVFAVLLSVTYIEVPDGVKTTSLVVETISVISLVITALILIKLRGRIRNDRTFVQINLSLSLLFLHVFNLLHDYALQNNVTCQIAATLVHFFMLASSFWMMLEGITLVLKTTNQSMMLTSQHQRKLNGIRFALGWGVPAAVVSVALSIGYTHDIYMDKLDLTTNGSVIYKRCWLAPNMVIYSVMVPIGLVLLANTVILVKVAYFVHLKSSQANRFKPAVKRRQCFVNYEDLSATLKAVLTLLPVLGLPWIVSFLVGFGENPSIILIYANAVVNGLQGLFLFLLYCINSRVVRKLIMRKTIAGALSRPSGAATSVSAGTAMTSSQFRNGSN